MELIDVLAQAFKDEPATLENFVEFKDALGRAHTHLRHAQLVADRCGRDFYSNSIGEALKEVQYLLTVPSTEWLNEDDEEVEDA